jgi:hypothetical protein
MSLKLYLNHHWIRKHESSPDEISRLLAIADRDIEQSQTPGLGPEWRFDIAYNAVLQLATAARAASGYQAERQNKHLRTIECLEFTAGLDRATVTFLDRCRRKRHTAVYDQIGVISGHEADEMIAAAKKLRVAVQSWLEQNHSALLS